jgi:hypothetical protein
VTQDGLNLHLVAQGLARAAVFISSPAVAALKSKFHQQFEHTAADRRLAVKPRSPVKDPIAPPQPELAKRGSPTFLIISATAKGCAIGLHRPARTLRITSR